MSQSNVVVFEGVEQTPIENFAEKAYLDYSMYVIMDRALPHIGDGLKPVQRRIIYAMSELGLSAQAKYKKSARTVGDVLGKFHPHGDTACYEAMVLMAQSFSYRYPLVDGQGNWGSPDDPKSFAAMRYTESRLSAFTQLLLSELGQGTVDWAPNFDATLEEPKVLPARLPTLLLNGTTGIAVGMATDILPHNLKEVGEACIHLLKHPKATTQELTKIVPGPDFPTSAEIVTPVEDIRKIAETGMGSIKMRATYIVEDSEIIITALPYQVSGAKILEQIAAQMQAKKLPLVADLRDESDHEDPTRLVIVPRSNKVDKDALMLHLFASTDCEKNYRVNMNVIGLDNRPRVKSLKDILQEWLIFRVETVRKRLNYRLEKVTSRLHILDGLLIAFLNIDEIISIIRYEDKPKAVLMKRFGLSDTQADAILDLKLRNLAKLEEQKIKAEQKELAQERKQLETTLSSDARLKTLVRKEIESDIKTFGDERRSPIVIREQAQLIKQTDRIAQEPITIVLSKKGWVRAAKGLEVDGQQMNFKAGDAFLMQTPAKSNDWIYFLDSTGRSYCLMGHTLPSARGQGEPLTSTLNPPSGALFVGALTGEATDCVVLMSSFGYGFISNLNELMTKNRGGKALLKVPEGSTALAPLLLSKEQTRIALVSSEGRLLVLERDEFSLLSKGKGAKMVQLSKGKEEGTQETVSFIRALSPKESLQVFVKNKKLTLTPRNLDDYLGEKAKRGQKLPRGYAKVTDVEVVKKQGK